MNQSQPTIKITTDRLLINGVVSVESWERLIQTKLVETIVKPTDVVVEFGYGLGMASEAIQKISPRDHWIIEAHYQVLIPILERKLHHINFIVSPWQKALPMIKDGSFDAIVYDADPDNISTFDGSADATLEFILPILPNVKRILAPGGRLGFIDFSGVLQTHFDFRSKINSFNLDVEFVSIPVDPPLNCSYAKKGVGNIIKIIRT